MKFNFDSIHIVSVPKGEERKIELRLGVSSESEKDFLDVADYLFTSKNLTADIERTYPSRSKNANAMFWSLCERLAAAVGTTNQEMYEQLIQEYGSSTIITIDNDDDADDVYDVLKTKYRIVDVVGYVVINGKACVQFRCFKGSHTYTTQQMGRLLDGTLAECKELGIPTESRIDIARAKQEWGKEKEGDNERSII